MPLPGAYFVFLGGVTITYLVLVEVVKRRLMRQTARQGPRNTDDDIGHASILGPHTNDPGGQKWLPDAEIQKFVQRHHGFIPKTGWIAHVKEVHGIPTLRGASRARRDRDVEPCPPKSARRSKKRSGTSA